MARRSTRSATRPHRASVATPSHNAVERRALEAVIWGMPAVNYDLMLQEMITKTRGKINQVIYWGRPLDWRNQTLTPNPDTLYFMAFLDTRDVGPIVIDVPPAGDDGALNANIVNPWQEPLEDAGKLGVDQGKGVKLLMLPPSYAGKVPDCYQALRPGTFGSYALIRSNLASHGDSDVAKAAAYGKRLKIYPLSEAPAPKPTVFTDVKDVLFDSTICYDASFFVGLNRIVQGEPWFERDRAMIDPLRTLGIEKRKPFVPSAATKKALLNGVSIKDKNGKSYDGGKTYRLIVPPNPPVEQYWSVTAYDRETPALIKKVNRASRASNSADVQKNADGSVEIYFGPKAPRGKESNWVPTDKARRFELMFRFYAPTNALFEKKWALPDVEIVKAG